MLLGAPMAVAAEASADRDAADVADGGLLYVRLDEVHRNEQQPRSQFDTASIHALAVSIEEHGVIQPIAVRRRPAGGYQIVAGERRWLAARQAGLPSIPAVVHDVDERETLVLALVENLVREDLSPMETARAYAALQDEFGMSVAELARSVGRSRPAVANTLRLLELPDDVIDLVEQRRITEGHGRALLGCSDRVRLQRLARLTLSQSLTVRALEALVREEEAAARSGIPAAHARRSKWNLDPAPELVEQVARISDRVSGVRARVRVGEQGAKLELRCDDAQRLFDLIELLDDALGGTAAARHEHDAA